jgi:ribosomal protein S18 acetylase RimI-like enzyme
VAKRTDKPLHIPMECEDALRHILEAKPAPKGETVPIIRTFAEGDREGVIALWEEAFPDEPTHNVSSAMIDRKLAVQPELFLVAVIDGAVVGTVMAGFDGVRGWLHRLAVRSSARRLGIGTLLARVAETALDAMGCQKVNLQVRTSNDSVVAFYQSIGYSVEDRVSLGRKL